MDAEDDALEHVGQIIADKYRLLNLLGAGGMGAVYEAEHVFTKRRVALKRMHPSIAKSTLAAERFVRESQAPSSIGHPGIVQVLDGQLRANARRPAGSRAGSSRRWPQACWSPGCSPCCDSSSATRKCRSPRRAIQAWSRR